MYAHHPSNVCTYVRPIVISTNHEICLYCPSFNCIPHIRTEFGDVYLGNFSETTCGTFTEITESGEVTFYSTEGDWVSVCAESFGYLEAHVVCTQLFFPFVEHVYQMER